MLKNICFVIVALMTTATSEASIVKDLTIKTAADSVVLFNLIKGLSDKCSINTSESAPSYENYKMLISQKLRISLGKFEGILRDEYDAYQDVAERIKFHPCEDYDNERFISSLATRFDSALDRLRHADALQEPLMTM